MRIYKNDIIKASVISTGADRGVLLCSITDSGFTSIAGVISAVKDKLPGKDHKNNIKVISVGHPKEYNYGTDWINVEVEFCDEWRQKMLSNIGKIVNDDKCRKYAEANYRSVSGYIFLGPEDLNEFEKEIIERKSDSGYDVTIL